MATFSFLDIPQSFDLTSANNKSVFLQSLLDSRQSVTSGAFLTKANVVPKTLQHVGYLDLCFGVHQFPQTLVAKATVTINVRQTVPTTRPPPTSTTSSAPNSSATKPAAIVKTVNVPELVFSFKENPQVFFVVPRDSTLEKPSETQHLYTFLTLRNQPGGTTLEHQVVPVTFESTLESDRVVQVMATHINKYKEVKDKMANAFRHIPKMSVTYLDFTTKSAGEMIRTAEMRSSEDQVGDKGLSPAHGDKKSRRKGSRKANEILGDVKEVKKQRKQREPRIARDSPVTQKVKKQKKASIIPDGWKCELCGTTSTVMRRRGPSGLNCACNSCGQSWSQANRNRSNEEPSALKPEE